MSAFNLDRITASGLVGTIDYHDSIGSTSDRALELGARDNWQPPVLVLAKHQTAGRGRGLNSWTAGAGALTFSLLLHATPDRLLPRRWPQTALAAGVAVCDALQKSTQGADLRVKWPNDVYLSGRKICGILSESIPGFRDRLVVGIGINVNNMVPLGISLCEHDGLARDLTEVLLTVLDQLDRRWTELLDDRFGAIAADYRQHCFLSGRFVRIQQPGERIISGLCNGIDDDGALVVQSETTKERIVSGTVVEWEC